MENHTYHKANLPNTNIDANVWRMSLQLDVTGLNYVSRMNEPFVLVTVEHAAFSSDGQWLATVSMGRLQHLICLVQTATDLSLF